MRVPVPVEWDSRHVVALLEFARVINAHYHQQQQQLTQPSTHPSSSSSNSCTDSSSGLGPALPPVALGLVAANLVIFFKPGGVLLRDVSLSPYCVLDRKQWYRLATAAFVHVDATHLITNLTAALPEVLLLEEVQGSAPLLADLALLTLLSHLLYGEGGVGDGGLWGTAGSVSAAAG
jgi:rhomboid domain-containing protein 1